MGKSFFIHFIESKFRSSVRRSQYCISHINVLFATVAYNASTASLAFKRFLS